MADHKYRAVLLTAVGVVVGVAVLYGLYKALFSGEEASFDTFTNGTRAVHTLEFLVVFTRHGNRGPLATFPKFIYPKDNKEAWPYGPAQLTGHGRRQMYRLGTTLRTLYEGFLGPFYFEQEIKASSTPVDRTLMSAQSLLAGLYPPRGFQEWADNIPWQPIPIYPNFLDHTKWVPPVPLPECPKFRQAQTEAFSVFEKENTANITAVLQSVSEETGIPATDSPFMALHSLWESLYFAETEGLLLPTWVEEVYPQPLATMMGKFLTVMTIGSDTQIRLVQGLLFQEVVRIMDSKVKGTLAVGQKMHYYSGHDYTLLGLKGIFGLQHSESAGLVSPATALVIEMHKDLTNDSRYVQLVMLDGSSLEVPLKVVDIPGCPAPCDFNQLKTVTAKYYDIADFENECLAD